MSTKLQICYL